VPRRLRRETPIRLAYIRGLLGVGGGDEAEAEIEDYLKRYWDSDMVLLYGTVEGGNPEGRLRQAENWLRQHPGDAALLLTLARLCVRNQLWGKAHQYLDQSIAISPRPDSYEELGRLLEHMDDTAQASAAYRRGLEMAVDRAANVPGTTPPVVPRPGDGTV
jgi:HemY protein